MPPAGFEPVIPAYERPQTHALDCAITGIGALYVVSRNIICEFVSRDGTNLMLHHSRAEVQYHSFRCSKEPTRHFLHSNLRKSSPRPKIYVCIQLCNL
jgi:hypothetical protein